MTIGKPLSKAESVKRITLLALWCAVVFIIDWVVLPKHGIGVLYVVPVLMATRWLPQDLIVLMAAVCTLLANGPALWNFGLDAVLTSMGMFLTMVALAFFVMDLYAEQASAVEMAREANQRLEVSLSREEQLRRLVDSSPAGVLIADESENILVANRSAEEILEMPGASLVGRTLSSYLPSLGGVARVPRASTLHQEMLECKARRRDGQSFFTDASVSVFETKAGKRLGAILVDPSRFRSEDGAEKADGGAPLYKLDKASNLHEIRNLSWAITVLCANLARREDLSNDTDFRTLQNLVSGLARISATELRTDAPSTTVNLQDVFQQLRSVLATALTEAGAELIVSIGPSAPSVRGDVQGLLQVFLNLAQNSLKAMADVPSRVLKITVAEEASRVLVVLQDTGTGLADPEAAFRPTLSRSGIRRIGLSFSRALVRTYGGDLRYEPQTEGCGFVVELCRAENDEGAQE